MAILGVTKVAERLAMVDGQVVVKHLLPLSLSYDHRVINGADAARFCRFVAAQLADPALLV
ncbi:Dihydrolipoyllysine-residue acetyltransferase component of pyruvate dehydrogenase complex [compost metagenome]